MHVCFDDTLQLVNKNSMVHKMNISVKKFNIEIFPFQTTLFYILLNKITDLDVYLKYEM